MQQVSIQTQSKPRDFATIQQLLIFIKSGHPCFLPISKSWKDTSFFPHLCDRITYLGTLLSKNSSKCKELVCKRRIAGQWIPSLKTAQSYCCSFWSWLGMLKTICQAGGNESSSHFIEGGGWGTAVLVPMRKVSGLVQSLPPSPLSKHGTKNLDNNYNNAFMLYKAPKL